MARDASGQQLLSCADVVLDQARWTVHRAGIPVELSPTEFRLLACLLRHQDLVLSKDELLRQVWGPDFTGQSQVVETYISYLRRKLHRLGPPLIRTRRGQGYMLTLGAGDRGSKGATAMILGQEARKPEHNDP